MSAHTPGPWVAGRIGRHDRWSICGTGEREDLIVADCTRGPGTTEEQREANARLIAAAPDLLAACQQADTFLLFLEGSVARDTLNAIRAAIAKALGENDAS